MPLLSSMVFKVYCFLKALSHLQKNVQTAVSERKTENYARSFFFYLMH